MSTRGVVDIVFCIDASDSMRPCINGVKEHVVSFIKGLEGGQSKMDWRIDYLAHSCDISGGPHRMESIRTENLGLMQALYHSPGSNFFTTDLGEFQRKLSTVEVFGDEATLVALDTALDYPWRPRSKCHRVVVCLTDEPLETGAAVAAQREQLPAIIDKIQKLGVMLFLVGPHSDGYASLSEVDKSEYEVVDHAGDGLRTVNFAKVLEYIGKSVSMASLQTVEDKGVRRALYGQDTWGSSDAPITGR